MDLLDYKDIHEILEKHYIKNGDNLFVHGNAMVIAQMKGNTLNEKIFNFWNSIIQYIGPNGTVIVPTFTYSPMKKEVYDYKITKSSVGQFSEQFRLLPFAKRTLHPIFSVAYTGALERKIANTSLNTCFGKDSVFQLLLSDNFKIFCFGCSFNTVTFIHFIEENLKVKYRFYKYFVCQYLLNNQIKTIKVEYFVRDLNLEISTKPNLKKIKNTLIEKKKLQDFTLFLNTVYSVKAFDMYDTCNILYKNNPFCFIN